MLGAVQRSRYISDITRAQCRRFLSLPHKQSQRSLDYTRDNKTKQAQSEILWLHCVSLRMTQTGFIIVWTISFWAFPVIPSVMTPHNIAFCGHREKSQIISHCNNFCHPSNLSRHTELTEICQILFLFAFIIHLYLYKIF